jgi:hypothetical protein
MKATPIREKEHTAEGTGGSAERQRGPGNEGEGPERGAKRDGITGASDSAISGNDRKKGRSFVRAERTAEERSAKKNEGQLGGG